MEFCKPPTSSLLFVSLMEILRSPLVIWSMSDSSFEIIASFLPTIIYVTGIIINKIIIAEGEFYKTGSK